MIMVVQGANALERVHKIGLGNVKGGDQARARRLPFWWAQAASRPLGRRVWNASDLCGQQIT